MTQGKKKPAGIPAGELEAGLATAIFPEHA